MDVIRIETRCNQNCIFCGADPHNEGDYTLDLRDLAVKIRNARPDEIVEISGGEPTLSPLLPKILALAKRMERRISLQSNGMRFANYRFARAMAEAGLTHAFISLHAPTADLADRITGRAGAFEQTVAGIHNLMQARVHVSLNFVICSENAHAMGDYVRFVAKTFGGGLPVVFSFINPFHNAWNRPELIPKIGDIIAELRRALTDGEALGLEMHVPDICGIPICFLAGMEGFADKYRAFREGWPFAPHRQKVKGPACADCVWNDSCDGLWERYVSLYGAQELVAVHERPDTPARGDLARPSCSTHSVPSNGGRAEDTAFLVGNGCTNNCLFCNEGGKNASRTPMTLASARELLERSRPDWVFLSGGEPTTCRNLADYVRLAREFGVRDITLVSNGSGVADYKLLRSLVAEGLNEVRLSIHGPDAALHDKLTQHAGAFADIESAVKNCNALKDEFELKTVALFVVNRLNLDALAESVRRFLGWKFDKIGLGVVEPTRNAARHFDEIVPRYSDVALAVEDLVDELGDAMKRAGVQFYVDNLPPCVLERDDIPLGERSIITTLDGQSPNLTEMAPTRDKTFGPVCEGCPARGRCEGVFAAYARRFGWDEFGYRR